MVYKEPKLQVSIQGDQNLVLKISGREKIRPTSSLSRSYSLEEGFREDFSDEPQVKGSLKNWKDFNSKEEKWVGREKT